MREDLKLGEGSTVICRPNVPIDGSLNGYGWLTFFPETRGVDKEKV